MRSGFRYLLAAWSIVALAQSPAAGANPEELWDLWPEERFVTTSAPCIRPAELYESLEALAGHYPDNLRLEEIGRSFEDRPIYMVTLGRGPTKILLWSQMHGDEPSATPALLDIADYLLGHSDEPDARAILDNLTLLMIPMLNPDGSEIYERRNAQGIDVNRDALSLATPEGRLLKKIRDEHDPLLGFNLHDQNRRTAVGDTGKLATNAVLAVAGDPEGTLTPERARAKRACSAIVEALAPFMPGGMARYDEDWSPRAFGDNLTAWGTAVVLIESGGLPPGEEMTTLTRLNFVAILTVLEDLVEDDLANYDPEIYEALPRNESDAWSDLVVRGGHLLQPGSSTPYRADLAINLSEDDLLAAGCVLERPRRSEIAELGDARFIAAGREVDATDALITAPFEVGVEGWRARKWLNEEAVQELVGLGVGRIWWEVPKRHLDKAEARAAVLAAGGPRVEVAIGSGGASRMNLEKRPDEPRSELLRHAVDALAAASRDSAGLSPEAALDALWSPAASSRAAGPFIRRRTPASFLLVRQPENGRIDLETARLDSVWINGHEVATAQ